MPDSHAVNAAGFQKATGIATTAAQDITHSLSCLARRWFYHLRHLRTVRKSVTTDTDKTISTCIDCWSSGLL